MNAKQLQAMFNAQDESRANREWLEYRRGLIAEKTPVVVSDEDVKFAVALAGNAGGLGFDDLMAEAFRRDDEAAMQFEWSVQQDANHSGNARL